MRHLLILACLLVVGIVWAEDFNFNSPKAKAAMEKYQYDKEDLLRDLEAALKYERTEGSLEEAIKIRDAIKALKTGDSPAGGRKGNKLAFPRGQWVDVLGRVDIKKHSLEGHWTKRGQDIVVDQKMTACRLIVPVAPEGDYDFEIRFSRLSEIPGAWTPTVAIVPVGSASCLVWFHRGGWSGIDRINGRRPGDSDNPTSVNIKMENNRRYIAVISVRHHPNQKVTIRVSLDGKVLFAWNGPAAAVSLNPDWKRLWPSNTLGLGAFCTQTVFHSARLRVVSGEIQDVKIGEPTQPKFDEPDIDEPDEEPIKKLSPQHAKRVLDDANLWEGKPGVWFLKQANNFTTRSYELLSRDRKIRSALRAVNGRLPTSGEMKNPPVRR